MADIQPIRRAGDSRAGVPWALLGIVMLYWTVAAVVINDAYQDAFQRQAHRIDALTQNGLLTYNGKLNKSRIAPLAAEAEANRVCWDAHPKPDDEPEPWYPSECGVYQPRDQISDVDAATFAALHRDSAAQMAWDAARSPLLTCLLGFIGLGCVAMFATWVVGRTEARSAD